jgi:sulfur-oxidizing protein SoxZ
MARALVNVPKTAKRGDVVEIRTLISHEMETGYRPGPNGRLLPRNIITHFSCRWGDEVVFEAELSPAMSANPYLVFSALATASGTITLTWRGDNGFEQTETATIEVT